MVRLDELILYYRVQAQKAKEDKDKKMIDIMQSSLWKIVLDFIQMLGLTSEFKFRWPEIVKKCLYYKPHIYQIGQIYSVFTKSAPENRDAFSVDCYIALSKNTFLYYKLSESS